MSIKWKESAELNHMTVDKLKACFKRFPQSHRRVVAVCESEGCENPERIIVYKRYRDLCKSCAQKKRWEDSKEREKQSERQNKRYEDPKEREKSVIIQKKRYAEMDDPGLEMCTHHYIYDFNDLTKYTIEVTRGEHTTIHHNLRRAGLQVPCINILKDE